MNSHDVVGPCPFLRAVADGRRRDAIRLAAAPPDPAEPVVIAWLLDEARRYLDQAGAVTR